MAKIITYIFLTILLFTQSTVRSSFVPTIFKCTFMSDSSLFELSTLDKDNSQPMSGGFFHYNICGNILKKCITDSRFAFYDDKDKCLRTSADSDSPALFRVLADGKGFVLRFEGGDTLESGRKLNTEIELICDEQAKTESRYFSFDRIEFDKEKATYFATTKTKFGCPSSQYSQLTEFNNSFYFLIGPLIIALGLTAIFCGSLYQKTMVLSICIFFTLWIGTFAIWLKLPGELGSYWFYIFYPIFVLVGVGLGFISFEFQKICFPLISGIIGMLFVFFILMEVAFFLGDLNDWLLGSLLVVGFATGCLIGIYERKLTKIIVFVFFGFIVVFNGLLVFSKIPLALFVKLIMLGETDRMMSYMGTWFYVAIAVDGMLSLIGIYVQYRTKVRENLDESTFSETDLIYIKMKL